MGFFFVGVMIGEVEQGIFSERMAVLLLFLKGSGSTFDIEFEKNYAGKLVLLVRYDGGKTSKQKTTRS